MYLFSSSAAFRMAEDDAMKHFNTIINSNHINDLHMNYSKREH